MADLRKEGMGKFKPFPKAKFLVWLVVQTLTNYLYLSVVSGHRPKDAPMGIGTPGTPLGWVRGPASTKYETGRPIIKICAGPSVSSTVHQLMIDFSI